MEHVGSDAKRSTIPVAQQLDNGDFLGSGLIGYVVQIPEFESEQQERLKRMKRRMEIQSQNRERDVKEFESNKRSKLVECPAHLASNGEESISPPVLVAHENISNEHTTIETVGFAAKTETSQVLPPVTGLNTTGNGLETVELTTQNGFSTAENLLNNTTENGFHTTENLFKNTTENCFHTTENLFKNTTATGFHTTENQFKNTTATGFHTTELLFKNTTENGLSTVAEVENVFHIGLVTESSDSNSPLDMTMPKAPEVFNGDDGEEMDTSPPTNFDQLSPTTQFVMAISAGRPKTNLVPVIPYDVELVKQELIVPAAGTEDSVRVEDMVQSEPGLALSVAKPSPVQDSKLATKKRSTSHKNRKQNLSVDFLLLTNSRNLSIDWDVESTYNSTKSSVGAQSPSCNQFPSKSPLAEKKYLDYIDRVVCNSTEQMAMWKRLQKFQVWSIDLPLNLHFRGRACCLVDPKKKPCEVVRRAKRCFLNRARVIYKWVYPHVARNERKLRQILEEMWSLLPAKRKELIYFDKCQLFYYKVISIVVKFPPGEFERKFFQTYFPKGIRQHPATPILVSLPKVEQDDDGEQKIFSESFGNKFLGFPGTAVDPHWTEVLEQAVPSLAA